MDEVIENELKQIDEILNYFRTIFEQGGLTFDNLVTQFDYDHKRNFGHSLIAILEKLERDKLIFKVPNNSYYITLEGKIFNGYVQHQKDEIAFKRTKEGYDLRMKRYARSLSIGTWFLVSSTLFLALVELLKK